MTSHQDGLGRMCKPHIPYRQAELWGLVAAELCLPGSVSADGTVVESPAETLEGADGQPVRLAVCASCVAGRLGSLVSIVG